MALEKPKLQKNRYFTSSFLELFLIANIFLKAEKPAYSSSIHRLAWNKFSVYHHAANTIKIFGLSNIFSAFSPHTNYLILLHLRSGLLTLPEGVWKFQAGIAPSLLKKFFLACNLISSGSDLIPLMPGAWRPVLICILDVWRKNETIERTARGQECSSKSK